MTTARFLTHVVVVPCKTGLLRYCSQRAYIGREARVIRSEPDHVLLDFGTELRWLPASHVEVAV